jgi:hypothetical protein
MKNKKRCERKWSLRKLIYYHSICLEVKKTQKYTSEQQKPLIIKFGTLAEVRLEDLPNTNYK